MLKVSIYSRTKSISSWFLVTGDIVLHLKDYKNRNGVGIISLSLSLSVEVLGKPYASRKRSNRCLRQAGIYMIAQSVPFLTKGHTYAMCYIHDGVDAHRCPPLNAWLKFPRFQLIRRKRKANVFLVKIGQALDSRQRLIASNPQNDKCKSNEKNRFFQTFMG